ncbi:Phage integrase, N-terminal SAM-like domain [Sphingobacterium wenxiniae]|uniref:Phage integrase, N-terminal SAM-like domain n=1 Tax=Sphingobacterium wenxiniae TaxID=683125 RepID=A0A1I6TFB5_9SPHI|nr:site-specific integrase [Sphingobacterium wenxiniae]SFS87884.1 Phage integrase, N-terminal SAM-like domain [Sphingobacterium wenxiniae]
MNSEIILDTFEKRLSIQRYADNTIRSYKDYASVFLKHVSKYPSLEDVPLSEIEAFINEKVKNTKISVSYHKGLVGSGRAV